MKIAVYGASGYQGKLVAAELTRRNIEPVLVGRNANRLSFAATESGVGDAERKVADTDAPDDLVAAFHGAEAVINCAGPFTSTGETVARAAIRAGCHYVDTSGEQIHIKHMYDVLATDAEQAGVTVIPAATDSGVPGDLIAHLIHERLGPLEELISAHTISGGGISRGSLRSLMEIIETVRGGGLTYIEGGWLADVPARRDSIVFPGATAAVPVVKFGLQEAVTVPRHVRVRCVQGVGEAAVAAQFSTPIPPEVIETLPDGPDEDGRRAQRFGMVIDAVGVDGRQARGMAEGSDTYGTTALIIVEAARRLAADGAKPGVLAPAQAFNPADFLEFLDRNGVRWSIKTR